MNKIDSIIYFDDLEDMYRFEFEDMTSHSLEIRRDSFSGSELSVIQLSATKFRVVLSSTYYTYYIHTVFGFLDMLTYTRVGD